MFIIAMKSVY